VEEPSERGASPAVPGKNRLPRVVNGDGDDFQGSAGLIIIHPSFAVADHDALIADEQIAPHGGGDCRLDLGREDPRVIGARRSGAAVVTGRPGDKSTVSGCFTIAVRAA
jgi:hypothetical protein